ncbi:MULTISPECIES: hypothetical protein [Erwinia]|uniref:Lipoprotein n=1 Tax=Erwinia papayae TaxID=206499 RepID=A0ABV3MXC0_9GAMM|nr:hypothetical protein [Erwinia mallotivora]
MRTLIKAVSVLGVIMMLSGCIIDDGYRGGPGWHHGGGYHGGPHYGYRYGPGPNRC